MSKLMFENEFGNDGLIHAVENSTPVKQSPNAARTKDGFDNYKIGFQGEKDGDATVIVYLGEDYGNILSLNEIGVGMRLGGTWILNAVFRTKKESFMLDTQIYSKKNRMLMFFWQDGFPLNHEIFRFEPQVYEASVREQVIGIITINGNINTSIPTYSPSVLFKMLDVSYMAQEKYLTEVMKLDPYDPRFNSAVTALIGYENDQAERVVPLLTDSFLTGVLEATNKLINTITMLEDRVSSINVVPSLTNTNKVIERREIKDMFVNRHASGYPFELSMDGSATLLTTRGGIALWTTRSTLRRYRSYVVHERIPKLSDVVSLPFTIEDGFDAMLTYKPDVNYLKAGTLIYYSGDEAPILFSS